jgi:hypothetical protein
MGSRWAPETTSNDSESWSRSSASASGPTLPAGLTLDALPSPAATGLTLNLYTSTAANATPAATLNLNTFPVRFPQGGWGGRRLLRRFGRDRRPEQQLPRPTRKPVPTGGLEPQFA